MKYDADLQEIDARLDVRGNVYEEESGSPDGVQTGDREMRKRTVATEQPWNGGLGRRTAIYTRAIILCYRCHVSASCLS